MDSVKDGSTVVGNRTRVKVVKNKLSPPFKQAEFDIIFGSGISSIGCILDIAVEMGLIVKAGSWFSYEGERVGQGREKAIDYIKNNPELYAILEEKIRESF